MDLKSRKKKQIQNKKYKNIEGFFVVVLLKLKNTA